MSNSAFSQPPAGPQGATGATGPAGSPGPAGPPGPGTVAGTLKPLKGDGVGNAIGEVSQYVNNADGINISPGVNVVILNNQQTAPRTYILPPSAGYAVGDKIRFLDPLGYSGAGNSVSVIRSGLDTVNGLTTAVQVINLQYGMAEVILFASGAWGVVNSVKTAFDAINCFSLFGITSGALPPVPGRVGEYLSAQVVQGSAIALTTAVNANVTTLLLTPGEWDVSGAIGVAPAATTSMTAIIGGTSIASAAFNPAEQVLIHRFPALVIGAFSFIYPLPVVRIGVAVNTTIYLVAQAVFTVSTCGAFGTLRARRVS